MDMQRVYVGMARLAVQCSSTSVADTRPFRSSVSTMLALDDLAVIRVRHSG
jgi:hypothetical protein